MLKRLLIITYYWPPTGGSGVQRWVKFCKYLPDFGWQPVVYTPENPEQLARDESLLSDVPACAEVIKTRILEPYAVYRRLTGGKQGEEVNPVNAQKKNWKQRLSLCKKRVDRLCVVQCFFPCEIMPDRLQYRFDIRGDQQMKFAPVEVRNMIAA